MNPEDKFFIVSSPDGRLNVRSTAKVEDGNDLGDFDLINGDVIHAVGVEVSGGFTFHRFDRIHRNGTRHDFPFKGFPGYVASPTGKHWVAEKAGADVLMAETTNPESPGKVSDTVGKPINAPVHPTTAKKYVGWRVLHKAEGGYGKTPPGMPEVIPPEDQIGLSMTKEIQEMSFNLMTHFNPAINKKSWTQVHHGHIAFTNYQGFGTEPKSGGPRANFITGEDLDKELPKYDKMGRVCGGMFIRGIERGDKLVCQPGVHGIDATKPLPSIQTIVENNWYFYAICFFPRNLDHFPQGKGAPVAIPFIFDREIVFPLSLLEKWEDDKLPDPLKIYRK